MRARIAILIAAAGLSLGGCAYNGFGLGVGYGNDLYGYGYGPYGGYGYDPYYGYGYGSGIGYGFGYGSPYGSYYGSPYWGWNNGFYYPGTGIYVYDPNRRRRVMTDAERQYWKDKFARYRAGTSSTATTRVVPQENWSGFKRSRSVSVDRQARRDARMQVLQTQRSERVQQRSERSQARSERIQSRIDRIQARRSEKANEQ